MWASGARGESLKFLKSFAASLAKDLHPEPDRGQRSNVSKQKFNELSKLLARCYFKQGQWQFEMEDNWGVVGISYLLYMQLLI